MIDAVPAAQQYTLGDLDRTEYIRSQMASYPEYRDRIADEMFAHPGKYPIFTRAIIETGYVMGPIPRVREWEEGYAEYRRLIESGVTEMQYATRAPGPVQFIGWMTPDEYAVYLAERDAARERDDG